jgi:hypothetical protein
VCDIRPAKGINFNPFAPPQACLLQKESSHMKTLKATLLLLALSLPLWAAKPDKDKKHDHDRPPVAVPEGGDPVAYMLASGLAIAGFLVIRKRLSS